MLSTWHAAGGSADTPSFKKHVLRVADYLWVSEDGMKMQGYNGSHGWDASFAMQALAEAKRTFCALRWRTFTKADLSNTDIASTDVTAMDELRGRTEKVALGDCDAVRHGPPNRRPWL